MGKWNNIPNEVLHLILLQLYYLKSRNELYIETRHLNNNCILVNKQWFLITLPIMYQEIEISFNKYNLIDTLLTSTYQPGQYVKKLTFVIDADLPKKTTIDLLCQVMIHCPKVTEAQIGNYFGEKAHAEICFFIALNKTKVWHLKRISPSRVWSSLTRYNYLANLMRDSLEHLELRQELKSYDYLKAFKHLKSLNVQFKGHANMTQCVNVLKNVPLLASLYVWFNKESVSKNSKNDSVWYNNNLQDIQPYTGIKDLTLSNFTPVTDEEIEFIIHTFTNLDFITVTTNHTYWINQASRSTVLHFLNFLQSIHTHHLGITLVPFDHHNGDQSINNNITFLKLYHQAFPHAHYMELNFTKEDYNNSLQISSISHQLSVTIGARNHPDVQNAKQILIAIGSHLTQIMIIFAGDQPETFINEYLIIIIEHCQNINSVTVSGGMLQQSGGAAATLPLKKLKSLTLLGTRIMPGSLTHLDHVVRVDHLYLKHCIP